MRQLATLADTRAADSSAAARVGEATLIERAATAVALEATRLLRSATGGVYGARVVILAGSGHNGADALLAGRMLARRGVQVAVIRTSDRAGDDLWQEAASGLTVVDEVGDVDLVLDGMVGVGATGALRGRAAGLAAALSPATPIVAVDIASGIAADTGAVDGPAVRADLTVTFDRAKPGHVLGHGAAHTGQLVVRPIGLDYPHEVAVEAVRIGVLDADDVAAFVPTPNPGADKYSRGVVGVVAGSQRYPGAAVLCTGGAIRAGAGYVRYAGFAGDAVRTAWPTAVVGDGRVDAYVCGPGLDGTGPERGAVERVLASEVAAVLDAGALDIGAEALRGRTAPTLITPHAGEFRRLTGVGPSSDPIGAACAAARELGVHVLLKGGHTVVAAPDGRVRINPTGCSWLSTAGTGDVLAGAAGALLAAAVKRGRPDVLGVGAAAAFLHGLAGRFAPVPLNAADLLAYWSRAVAAVRADG